MREEDAEDGGDAGTGVAEATAEGNFIFIF